MSAAESPVIELESLGKTYGSGARAVRAVQDVTISVAPGEVYGFLGPNGAGKTTTVRMLVTLLRPTGGRATVAGFDVADPPHDQVDATDGPAIPEPAAEAGGLEGPIGRLGCTRRHRRQSVAHHRRYRVGLLRYSKDATIGG